MDDFKTISPAGLLDTLWVLSSTRSRREEEELTKVHRSAKTGRFVKPSTVKRHPSTTVTETVKRSKKT